MDRKVTIIYIVERVVCLKRKIVLVALSLLIAAIALLISSRAFEYYVEPQYDSVTVPVLESIPAPVIPGEVIEDEEDRYDEYSENVVGWIQIPGIPIDDPILQNSDNSWYLNHNEYDEPDIWGAYFVNCMNDIGDAESLDRVTTIFGHANGYTTSPKFAALKLLRNPEYALACQTIYVWFGAELTTWEIFAAGEYPIDNDYLIPNPDDDYFLREVNSMKQASVNRYEKEVTCFDNVLILSTCAGDNNDDYRFIVCAVQKAVSNEIIDTPSLT